MRFHTFIIPMLLALAMALNIPNIGFAQDNQPAQAQTQTGVQAPQPKGGVATVIRVDQPDNCLRIRSGPGNSYDVIDCANMGDQLNITGVWTSNNWAQLAGAGWVYGPQIQTDLRPPQAAYSRTPTYVVSEAVVPDYDDWAYLPDYGYDTYWWGGIPIYFYNVGIWNRFHPWWWWRGLQAWWWKDGFHGRRVWDNRSFTNFARTRGVNVTAAARGNLSTLNRMRVTTRSASIASSNLNKFNVNRSNVTSPNVSRSNVNRFNANRSNITSPNVTRSNVNRFNTNRSNITSPNVTRSNVNRFNTNRSNITSPNVSRSNVNRFRSNIGSSNVNRLNTNRSSNAVRSRSFTSPTRTFSTGNTRTFSSPRPSSMGSSGARSFSGSSGRSFSGQATMGGGRHR